MATIKTPRLRLRHWVDSDIEPWVAMNGNPRVTEFFVTDYTREMSEQAAAIIRREVDELGYGWWVLEAPGVTPFAGSVCLRKVPFQAAFSPAYEVGWRLDPAYWGRGYATEGAQGAIDFAFQELGLDEVVAITATTNVRSQRVMQRLGMTHDPQDDFDHPIIDADHPLNRHLLYRIKAERQNE